MQTTALRAIQLILTTAFMFSQQHLVEKMKSIQGPIPQPIAAKEFRVISFGEPPLVAKMLSYWLLSYDTQSGQLIPFETLDYDRLTGWLGVMAELDPLSDESSMLAAGVFIDVKDERRRTKMIEFVRAQFNANAPLNWRWMAQCVMLSKYRLGNMPLALSLARDLRQQSRNTGIPYWAAEMEAYLLEDMGEIEAALLLLRAMISEGVIKDADELRFLNQRILELESSLN